MNWWIRWKCFKLPNVNLMLYRQQQKISLRYKRAKTERKMSAQILNYNQLFTALSVPNHIFIKMWLFILKVFCTIEKCRKDFLK